MANVRIGEYLLELFEFATFETGFGTPEVRRCSYTRCVLRAPSSTCCPPGVEARGVGLGLLEAGKCMYW